MGAGVNGEHAVGLGSQAQYPTGLGSPRHQVQTDLIGHVTAANQQAC
jgi:hypothetical protein